MEAFIIDQPETQWGDYSDILLQGMAERDEVSGLLQLERTGPFVPPISFPTFAVVVTDALRKRLEASLLTGFSFLPVVKRHIVLLKWERWDANAEEPEEYPESGEPEDYIDQSMHDPETAAQMTEPWELCITDGGGDFFYRPETRWVYVTPNAKDWFEAHTPQFVKFTPVRLD